jgi:hypothetical protein
MLNVFFLGQTGEECEEWKNCLIVLERQNSRSFLSTFSFENLLFSFIILELAHNYIHQTTTRVDTQIKLFVFFLLTKQLRNYILNISQH